MAGYDYTLKINTEIADLSEQLLNSISSAKKILDKNSQMINFSANEKELQQTILNLQKLVPNIDTSIQLNFDNSDIEKQFANLKKYISKGNKWKDISKAFRSDIEESMKGINFNAIYENAFKGKNLTIANTKKLIDDLSKEIQLQLKGEDGKDILYTYDQIMEKAKAAHNLYTVINSEYVHNKKIDTTGIEKDIKGMYDKIGSYMSKYAPDLMKGIESQYIKGLSDFREAIISVFNSFGKISQNGDNGALSIADLSGDINNKKLELDNEKKKLNLMKKQGVATAQGISDIADLIANSINEYEFKIEDAYSNGASDEEINKLTAQQEAEVKKLAKLFYELDNISDNLSYEEQERYSDIRDKLKNKIAKKVNEYIDLNEFNPKEVNETFDLVISQEAYDEQVIRVQQQEDKLKSLQDQQDRNIESARKLIEATDTANNASGKGTGAGSDSDYEELKKVTKERDDIQKRYDDLLNRYDNAIASTEYQNTRIQELEKTVKLYKEAADALENYYNNDIDAIQKDKDQITDLNNKLEESQKKIKAYEEEIQNISKKFEETQNALSALDGKDISAEELAKYINQGRELQNQRKELVKQLEIEKENVEKLKIQYNELFNNSTSKDELVQKTNELLDVSEKLKTANAQLEEYKSKIDKVSDELIDCYDKLKKYKFDPFEQVGKHLEQFDKSKNQRDFDKAAGYYGIYRKHGGTEKAINSAGEDVSEQLIERYNKLYASIVEAAKAKEKLASVGNEIYQLNQRNEKLQEEIEQLKAEKAAAESAAEAQRKLAEEREKANKSSSQSPASSKEKSVKSSEKKVKATAEELKKFMQDKGTVSADNKENVSVEVELVPKISDPAKFANDASKQATSPVEVEIVPKVNESSFSNNDILKELEQKEESLKKQIDETNKSIKNQEKWIKYLSVLNKNFETSGKKDATDQLRDTTERLIKYRSNPDEYSGYAYYKDILNVDWYKAYKEAESKKVAYSTLDRYKTDIEEFIYLESLQKLQNELEFRIKALEEEKTKQETLTNEINDIGNQKSKLGEDQTKSYTSLQSVQEQVDQITEAVERKNAAFQIEEQIVAGTTQREITSLQELIGWIVNVCDALKDIPQSFLSESNFDDENIKTIVNLLDPLLNVSFDNLKLPDTNIFSQLSKKKIGTLKTNISDFVNAINDFVKALSSPIPENSVFASIDNILNKSKELSDFASILNKSKDLQKHTSKQQEQSKADQEKETRISKNSEYLKNNESTIRNNVDTLLNSSKGVNVLNSNLEVLSDGIIRITSLTRDANGAFKEYTIESTNGTDLQIKKSKDAEQQGRAYLKLQQAIKNKTESTDTISEKSIKAETDKFEKILKQKYALENQIKSGDTTEVSANKYNEFTEALEKQRNVLNNLKEAHKEYQDQIDKSLNKEDLYKNDYKNAESLSAYDELIDKAQKYYSLKLKSSMGKTTAKEEDELRSLAKQFDSATKAENEYALSTEKITEKAEEFKKACIDAQNNVKVNWIEDLNSKIENLQIIGKNTEKSKRYFDYLDEIRKKVDDLNNILPVEDLSNENQIDSVRNLNSEIEIMMKNIKKSDFNLVSKNAKSNFKNNIVQWMSKNSAAAKAFEDELNGLLNKIDEIDDNVDLSELNNAFINLKREAAEAGKIGISFIDRIKMKFKDLAAYLISFVGFNDFISIVKDGISIVHDYDDAMTEMRKVTDASVESLKKYQKASFDVADTVGTTANQLQASTADWLRQGESLEKAKESAKDTTVLFNVSEFENIDDATDALVSMSQAYNDLDKMEIIDKLNYVGVCPNI